MDDLLLPGAAPFPQVRAEESRVVVTDSYLVINNVTAVHVGAACDVAVDGATRFEGNSGDGGAVLVASGLDADTPTPALPLSEYGSRDWRWTVATVSVRPCHSIQERRATRARPIACLGPLSMT